MITRTLPLYTNETLEEADLSPHTLILFKTEGGTYIVAEWVEEEWHPRSNGFSSEDNALDWCEDSQYRNRMQINYGA